MRRTEHSQMLQPTHLTFPRTSDHLGDTLSHTDLLRVGSSANISCNRPRVSAHRGGSMQPQGLSH